MNDPDMKTFNAVMIIEGSPELADLFDEDGEQRVVTEEDYIDAAQHLIDTGMCWVLQGHVGRQCQRMIDAGVCQGPGGEDRG